LPAIKGHFSFGEKGHYSFVRTQEKISLSNQS
jgi:hypothetical protein